MFSEISDSFPLCMMVLHFGTYSRGANVFPLKLLVNFWRLVGLSLGMIEVVEKICLQFFKCFMAAILDFQNGVC